MIICAPVFTNYQGQCCLNLELTATDEDSHDVDDETIDASSFLDQFTNIQPEEFIPLYLFSVNVQYGKYNISQVVCTYLVEMTFSTFKIPIS